MRIVNIEISTELIALLKVNQILAVLLVDLSLAVFVSSASHIKLTFHRLCRTNR